MCEQKTVEDIIASMGDENSPATGPIVFMTPKEREINLANLQAQQLRNVA